MKNIINPSKLGNRQNIHFVFHVSFSFFTCFKKSHPFRFIVGITELHISMCGKLIYFNITNKKYNCKGTK